jgi:hypothetical protein
MLYFQILCGAISDVAVTAMPSSDAKGVQATPQVLTRRKHQTYPASAQLNSIYLTKQT